MDPCKQIVDAIDLLAEKLDNAILGDPKHGGSPGQVAGLKAQITKKKAELVECRKSHRPFTIRSANVPIPGNLVDKAMEDFCRANDIRAGQLTIIKNGQLKFAHAYTLADPGYPITEVDSIFRMASISKAFTCAAIQVLLDKNLVQMATPVYPLLGITHAALGNQKPSMHINEITVGELVNHLGGWNDKNPKTDPLYLMGVQIPSSMYDPVFSNRDIAAKLKLPGPPTKMDVARFMYGEPLQFPPGSKVLDNAGKSTIAYSNFGYLLLGLVVEKASGMPYIDYVRQEVLRPISISDVFLARMMAGPLPREVSYDDSGTGPNAMEPNADTIASNPYGGKGFITELMDSGGGLAATATAIAQFIGNYVVWGIGHGRAAGYARSGEMSGTSSLAQSRLDGIDFVFTFNTSTFPVRPLFMDPKLDPGFTALTNLLNHLMDTGTPF